MTIGSTEAQGSAESAPGIDAFLAKQKPDFTGLKRKS
ncbi:hypothetical protein SAMN05444680_105172 [Variovorax sp. YR216]|nr:hypothetical protein SAMN05444680_105172 [Variovorax sp. YR216]